MTTEAQTQEETVIYQPLENDLKEKVSDMGTIRAAISDVRKMFDDPRYEQAAEGALHDRRLIMGAAELFYKKHHTPNEAAFTIDVDDRAAAEQIVELQQTEAYKKARELADSKPKTERIKFIPDTGEIKQVGNVDSETQELVEKNPMLVYSLISAAKRNLEGNTDLPPGVRDSLEITLAAAEAYITGEDPLPSVDQTATQEQGNEPLPPEIINIDFDKAKRDAEEIKKDPSFQALREQARKIREARRLAEEQDQN